MLSLRVRCRNQANSHSIGACDLESVIHRVRQILFAAKITLGGLHGDVAEEELNLLQFAAADMAQLGAGRAGQCAPTLCWDSTGSRRARQDFH